MNAYLSLFMVLVIILALSSNCTRQSVSPSPPQVSPSPQQSLQRPLRETELATSILQKTGDKYAAVSSYQDSGTVEVKLKGEQKQSEKFPFKTYFMRPKLFRFEWVDNSTGKPTSNIVWLNGEEISIGQEPNMLKRGEAFGLVAAAIRSQGAAHSIPRLLTNKIAGFALTDLAELSLEREELFDGELCYVIKGSHYELATVELWIDKNSYVIRKIRKTFKIDSTVKEEIHRTIKLDEKTRNAMFEPKLPASSQDVR